MTGLVSIACSIAHSDFNKSGFFSLATDIATLISRVACCAEMLCNTGISSCAAQGCALLVPNLGTEPRVALTLLLTSPLLWHVFAQEIKSDAKLST